MYAMLEREAIAAALPLHWPRRLPDMRQVLAAAEWARRHQPRAFPQLYQDLLTCILFLARTMRIRAVIDRHASKSGIDLPALHAALADDSAAVTEAEMIGRKYGVQGMPAWLVGQRYPVSRI